MITYTFNTKTIKGKDVELNVPVEGFYPKNNAPILNLEVMSDEQWNALVAEQKTE